MFDLIQKITERTQMSDTDISIAAGRSAKYITQLRSRNDEPAAFTNLLKVKFAEFLGDYQEKPPETNGTAGKNDKPTSQPNEAEMNLTVALELVKDLRKDTSQLGSTIDRQTTIIENLINRDTDNKLLRITEDITARLQSLTDVLAQVGAGHRFSDYNAVLRQIGIKDGDFLPDHRKRKRTDIRKSDMEQAEESL